MTSRIQHGLRVCFLFTITIIPLVNTSAFGDWKAGVAKVNVTPDKPMWMSGYGGRNRPAEGKLTDLWAKAIVLEAGDKQRAVLITLDLVGIDRGLSQSVCNSLKKEFGFDRKQIAICASHTHTGPVVGMNLRPLHYEVIDEEQQKLVIQYAESLEKKIVNVVGQAINDLGPSKLSWGSGKATFAVNRRENPERKVPELRAEGKLKGPFDHDVPVLAVRSPNDALKAVVFGYACHSTVLSFYQWSGDYAGFAQIELEKLHADCMAMFWAGCGADQNPLPRRKVELAQEYGGRLATAVDKVLSGKMAEADDALSTTYREIELPLDTLPTHEQIEQDAQNKNKFVAARAKMFLAQIASGKPLSKTYPYPVQCWKIGQEVQFVTLGGEVVVDFALRLKSELREEKTWVAGYSNDVMAYIPSRRVLREGGYEGGGSMVYYGLPTVWAPEVERLIVDEVHRQLK